MKQNRFDDALAGRDLRLCIAREHRDAVCASMMKAKPMLKAGQSPADVRGALVAAGERDEIADSAIAALTDVDDSAITHPPDVESIPAALWAISQEKIGTTEGHRKSAGAAAEPTIKHLDGATILREDPPPHRPVLAGLFDHHSLVEIVGPSKTRKSFTVLQVAFSLAARRDVFGFEVGGKFSVCVADMELSEADIQRRTWRMGRALGITPDEIGDRLRILPLVGVENPRDVIEKAAAGCEVLVCDPLYALCDGAETIENFREPLRWLRRMALARVAVVFVHHDAKGMAGDRPTRDRGSGPNITGRAVGARITLTPAAADPENTVVMGFMCSSYATPPPSAWTFTDDAFRPSDLPAEPERQSDRRARQKPRTSTYHEAAARILRTDGPMTPSTFKNRLREDLGLSKNDADTVTAALCCAEGPAHRWATKSFPPEHFIGLKKEQSSQSSQEDRQEDREDSLASLPARLIGGRTGWTATGEASDTCLELPLSDASDAPPNTIAHTRGDTQNRSKYVKSLARSSEASEGNGGETPTDPDDLREAAEFFDRSFPQ